MERRQVLKVLGLAGVGSAAFGRALTVLAADAPKVSEAMVSQAEWISGIKLTDEQRKMALEGLSDADAGYEKLRAVAIANSVPPAFTFDPVRGIATPRPASARPSAPKLRPRPLPASKDQIAFSPVAVLAEWVRTKAISSTELTKLYLARIEKLDPQLHAVITRTDDLALKQAAAADAEIAKGRYKGPLHGIPFGAKDLLAAKGYPTTWGSVPFKEQRIDENATVIDRLEAAGAVLVAKTAVGELAWGDVWFGGTCRNPWKLEQGSSGSSAGSASLTSAGCVGFAIGTETWGSIVSPSTRCGTTGLRPTFGRVSRAGVMALSWTMDKVGPIARSVGDCALVFDAIHGADPRDTWARQAAFSWPQERPLKSIRVGYVKSLFDADYTKFADKDEDKKPYEEWKTFDARSLDTLRSMGVDLKPIELDFSVPIPPLSAILSAEAATAFDVLLRDGRIDTLVRQTADAWPNVFRQGEMVPAVEYLRAQRLRTIVLHEMAKIMEPIDVYVVPSFGGDNELLTNLTGHPAVVVPNGFRSTDGTPTSITFQGRLDEDDVVLAVAQAYQQATDFHTKHPAL
ncbi:MAG TPA: amidase [Candidatus Polarisedimenticolaceae bacterium]|nr:amidase [Candidatus Polarisedimenticolaceae bacterium]